MELLSGKKITLYWTKQWFSKKILSFNRTWICRSSSLSRGYVHL